MKFSDSMGNAKIKRTKIMHINNANVVRGCLSENYLTRKFIARIILTRNIHDLCISLANCSCYCCTCVCASTSTHSFFWAVWLVFIIFSSYLRWPRRPYLSPISLFLIAISTRVYMKCSLVPRTSITAC